MDEDETTAVVGQPAESTGTEEMAADSASADASMAGNSDEDMSETYRTFTDQPFATLGEPTSDRRILMPNMDLAFRSTPMPLQWCKENAGGHTSSTTVGVIENMHQKGKKVLASGYMLNTPEADEASNLIGHGVARPSLDLTGSEWHYADEKGKKLEKSEDIVDHLDSGKPLHMAITKGTVSGATLVPFPAIDSTKIVLGPREARDTALVASAAAEFRPRVYTHELFDDPALVGPTMPTMGEDGRIYGHLAVFGQCHRSIQSECVMVPRSPSDYAHFHTSPAVRLDNGVRLPVGRLTVGTGHADPRLRPAPAAAHYDNTGACFALVRVGEDKHGIWFSGVAAPFADTATIEAGLSSPLSGDWRDFGKGLDLIAALAVNTPGFAVQGCDDDEGRPIALVASVGPVVRGHVPAITRADIRDWVREAFVEVTREQQFAAEQSVDDGVPAADTATPANEPSAGGGKSANELIEELLAGAGL